jgi:hypothetical protein
VYPCIFLLGRGVNRGGVFRIIYMKGKRGAMSKGNTTQQGVPRASEGSSRYVVGGVSFGVVQCG